MGYRDDFYIQANIIGITGDVERLPSVYFQNAQGEYGHITQVHSRDYNWGRTVVRNDPGWHISNVCPPDHACGAAVSHEVDGNGRFFHVSRSAFVAVAAMSAGDLDVAAQAIHRCPYEKTDPRSRAGRAAEQERFADLWDERHARDAKGRRGAIDYTADGLANRLLQVAYPDRL